MTVDHAQPTEDILSINKLIQSSADSRLSDEQVDVYFRSFRTFFVQAAHDIATEATGQKKQAIFQTICDLNCLFGLSLKNGIELPADLYEVAYDFDNPDYPGFSNLLPKLEGREYLALQS